MRELIECSFKDAGYKELSTNGEIAAVRNTALRFCKMSIACALQIQTYLKNLKFPLTILNIVILFH